MIASAEELSTQRAVTAAFVAADPTTITLTPRTRTRRPGGGWSSTNGTPRAPQVFKLIFQYDRGRTEVPDGIERRYDVVLLGEHNRIVDLGDFWQVASGERYEIIALYPANGYEVRAAANLFTDTPTEG